jgi:biopolymer transport protein ExbB
MRPTTSWFSDAPGGPIMFLILLAGLAGLAILLERLYAIVFRSRNNGRAFMERVIQLVRAGKIDEAIKLCAASTAALPDMGLLILRSRSRDESDLQNVADAAALHVLPQLGRRIRYLPTLSVASILLGVLGTVRALQAAFEAASTGLNAAFSHAVADALTPLAFGVAVSVVLVLARGYLESQSDFIREQIDEFSARLINALIDRPDVRLGHR